MLNIHNINAKYTKYMKILRLIGQDFSLPHNVYNKYRVLPASCVISIFLSGAK